MIGVFDSGHGGLTILRALAERFPARRFVYLGDHANVPYGNRASEEIVEFTRVAVEDALSAGMRAGCSRLQYGHLHCSSRPPARVAAAEPVGGSKRAGHRRTDGRGGHSDAVGLQDASVSSEVQQRPDCGLRNDPDDRVAGVSRGDQASAARKYRSPSRHAPNWQAPSRPGSPERLLDQLVKSGVDGLMQRTEHQPPHRAILGCTHFPLVEHLFRRHLPPFTRILSQPVVVADSLEDYFDAPSQVPRGKLAK